MKPWRSRGHSWIGFILLCGLVKPILGRELSSSPTPKEIVVAVFVNGRKVSEFEHIVRIENSYFATAGQFSNWRLRLPASSSIQISGQTFYPLESNGTKTSFDVRTQSLYIVARPTAFTGSVLNFSPHNNVRPITPQPGMFLNHNLELDGGPNGLQLSGLTEIGFFSKEGVLTTRFVGRDLTGSPIPYRLDTQLVRDFPSRRMTLTLGDAISDAVPWSRQVYFGGIRWASKFSTQPSFRPYAVPLLAGIAAEPSTVDIYVNSVRAGQQSVQTGPFSIENLPVMTGQGQIQMVVTDMLGRQQVITESYISTQQLLRKGVNEFSYEAGSLRHGFGTASSGYGQFFASGTQRRGISGTLTLDFHGEADAKLQNFGFGADYGRLPLGLISGGAALSHSGAGPGELVYGEFQHPARTFQYSASLQAASRQFQELGLLPDERVAKILAQVQISHSLRNRGSVAFGYLRRQLWDEPTKQQNDPAYLSFAGITASLSLRIFGRAFLSFSANYAPALRQGLSGGINLVVPIGRRRMLMSQTELQEGGGSLSTVEYSKQLPVGNGYGYRVRTAMNSPEQTDAGIYLQNATGSYGFEASDNGGSAAWRLTETGGLIGMNGQVFPSRWLNNSFALVEAPGGKGVEVYANNQFITKTNAHGVAVIPNLVPYDDNVVRLDDSGVPLSEAMDLSEKIVVPMPRAGAVVTFQVQPIKGALFVLTTKDGKPVPLGAVVKINGDSQTFLVALHGDVFVPNVSFPARLEATWNSQTCQATVERSPRNEPLPRIGPIICRRDK